MDKFFLRIKCIAVIVIISIVWTCVHYETGFTMASYNQDRPITQSKTSERQVAIACNVYEGEDVVMSMMDICDKYNVKITFFIGGVWANRNRDLLKTMADRGHDLQNHGYMHKLPTKIKVSENINEIQKTEDLVKDVTGKKTNLFEPPSGDFNRQTSQIVKNMGYKLVTWNVDTIDWRKDATKELILSRVKRKLVPGSIILMHPKPVTGQSFESVIKYLLSENYSIKTVTELIE